MKRVRLALYLCMFLSLMSMKVQAQFLMDMVDTTKSMGKGILGVYKKYDHLRIGGYIQPQFQIASEKGIKCYEGGDFAPEVSNRFTLRRSRIRIDYVHFGGNGQPGVQFAFQFDANEKGFTVRDVWGRIFENKFKLFSFTTGIFARPFGYEVNYSSSDRESPERGRMSQILMKSERDLGAMVSFDPRKDIGMWSNLKIDLGFLNGQGIVATGEFDNIKDLIARISLKPVHLSENILFSVGASTLQGGLLQNTKYRYFTGTINGIKTTVVDSSPSNLSSKSPRIYYGADTQLKIKNRIGFSEFRAEFITGRQTGTLLSSETPTTLMVGKDGYDVRNFNGAYFYYVQSLFSTRHQMVLKYDWYDPNSLVSGNEIGASGSNLTPANIKYNTLGIGY
ncbi:MAG: hypothetical protein WCP08_16935, partial [Prolixibacteraceae bacterium]